MENPQVPRHFTVAQWHFEEDMQQAVGPPYDTSYATVDEAKAKAKELAANQPGTIWVVYMAAWYAWTDDTPVSLDRVVGTSL